MHASRGFSVVGIRSRRVRESLRVLALTLVAASGFFAGRAESQTLTGEQIRQEWTGKTLNAQFGSGAQVRMVLAGDGTARVEGAAADTGTWRVTESGYCTKWLRLNDGQERCFAVMRGAAGRFVVSNPQGQPVSVVEIAP